MVFSENQHHFPETALADAGSWREGGADAATGRAFWPHAMVGSASYGTAPICGGHVCGWRTPRL